MLGHMSVGFQAIANDLSGLLKEIKMSVTGQGGQYNSSGPNS